MYNERIWLNPKDILEKEFKLDTRGYRPQEVDKFLDIVIRDYGEFNELIKQLNVDNQVLNDENSKLKQELRSLSTKIEVIKEQPTNEVSSVDLLRRISSLEKVIYGRRGVEEVE